MCLHKSVSRPASLATINIPERPRLASGLAAFILCLITGTPETCPGCLLIQADIGDVY